MAQLINFLDTTTNVYARLWNKYRPSILKMMLESETEPQQYQFYSHEFVALKSNQKSFSFALSVVPGKVVGYSKLPAIAKDLLTILQYSKKATELMEAHTFEFKLDRHFKLHVTRPVPAAE